MTLKDYVHKAVGFTSDSRAVRAGDLFFALKGEKTDGALFVPEILKKNPTAVFAERGFGQRFPDIRDPRIVEVDNVHAAHREAAGLFRARFTAPVVAVGGSNGKTTTKEFLATILASDRPILKTDKSQNGELGIPKTLEKLREDLRAAVIEVGIDGPGDMLRHVQLVAPDVALLTSIGEEHLNLLKTVDNVFSEERILVDETLKRGGRAYVPAADPYLQRLAKLPRVTSTPARPEDLDPSFRCLLGHPMARQNAALAAKVALDLGVPREKIAAALLVLEVPEGRGREIRLRPDVLILADHYNANVASMKAGLAYAREVADREKLPLKLVLGDMLDLGEAVAAAHDEVIAAAAQMLPKEVQLVGPEMSQRQARLAGLLSGGSVSSAPSSALARTPAQNLLQGPSVLLVKGSRGTALERVLQAMGVPL